MLRKEEANKNMSVLHIQKTEEDIRAGLEARIPIKISLIDQEMQDQVILYLEVSSRAVKANSLFLIRKLEIDQLASTLYLKLRSEKEGKQTEKMLEAQIELDPEMKRLRRNLIDLENDRSYYDKLLKALDYRATMLVNINKRETALANND